MTPHCLPPLNTPLLLFPDCGDIHRCAAYRVCRTAGEAADRWGSGGGVAGVQKRGWRNRGDEGQEGEVQPGVDDTPLYDQYDSHFLNAWVKPRRILSLAVWYTTLALV